MVEAKKEEEKEKRNRTRKRNTRMTKRKMEGKVWEEVAVE